MKTALFYSPRILGLVFVGFLCLFSLDAFSEFEGWTSVLAVLMHLLIPAVVLLVVFVSWRNDLFGAALFFLLAVAYIVMVGLDRHWSWYLAISGPALVVSVLFLTNRLSRKWYI